MRGGAGVGDAADGGNQVVDNILDCGGKAPDVAAQRMFHEASAGAQAAFKAAKIGSLGGSSAHQFLPRFELTDINHAVGSHSGTMNTASLDKLVPSPAQGRAISTSVLDKGLSSPAVNKPMPAAGLDKTLSAPGLDKAITAPGLDRAMPTAGFELGMSQGALGAPGALDLGQSLNGLIEATTNFIGQLGGILSKVFDFIMSLFTSGAEQLENGMSMLANGLESIGHSLSNMHLYDQAAEAAVDAMKLKGAV